MRILLLTLAVTLLAAAPASAFFKCRDWDKLDDAGKEKLLEERIDQVLNSNAAKRYGSINKVAVRRCLEGRIWDMRDQFDGICLEGKRASLQALNQEFDRYIWTCVNQRRR
jgi:hypothetical protein